MKKKLNILCVILLAGFLSFGGFCGGGGSNPDPTPPPQPVSGEVIGGSKVKLFTVGVQRCMSGIVTPSGESICLTYSHPDPKSLIRTSKGRKGSIVCGEAIYDAEVISANSAFVSCEGSGSRKGAAYTLNLNTLQAKKLYELDRGNWTGAFGAEIINGKQCIVGAAQLKVNGTSAHRWDKYYYVKNIFKFRNRYYMPGANLKSGYGGYFYADNLMGPYKWKNIAKGVWFMYGTPRPDDNVFALLGSNKVKFSSSGGKYSVSPYMNSATIWIVKADGSVHKVATAVGAKYFTHALWVKVKAGLYQLVATSSYGWKTTSGQSFLLSYIVGRKPTTKVLARFDEPEMRQVRSAKTKKGVVVFGGEYRKRGAVYYVK